ncbi:MAG: hypothetical protein LIP09_07355 [Bacteroidales bacterium]|nr:hypothetical protein [Bacteroidales bacterium]
MKQIPIDRELKITLLRWLKEGIDETELEEVESQHQPSQEERERERCQKAHQLFDRCFSCGFCDLFEGEGWCNPSKRLEQYNEFDKYGL